MDRLESTHTSLQMDTTPLVPCISTYYIYSFLVKTPTVFLFYIPSLFAERQLIYDQQFCELIKGWIDVSMKIYKREDDQRPIISNRTC